MPEAGLHHCPRPSHQGPRPLGMAPEIVLDRLPKSRSRRVKSRIPRIPRIRFRAHRRREDKRHRCESGEDTAGYDEHELSLVDEAKISQSFEVRDQENGQPAADASVDDQAIHARCEETGQELNAPIFDHGSVGDRRSRRSTTVRGGELAQEVEREEDGKQVDGDGCR